VATIGAIPLRFVNRGGQVIRAMGADTARTRAVRAWDAEALAAVMRMIV
jgi:hypothetical protein